MIPDPRTIPELRRLAERELFAQRELIRQLPETSTAQELMSANLRLLALWRETPRIYTKTPAPKKGKGTLVGLDMLAVNAVIDANPALALTDACNVMGWKATSSGRVSAAIKTRLLGRVPKRH